MTSPFSFSFGSSGSSASGGSSGFNFGSSSGATGSSASGGSSGFSFGSSSGATGSSASGGSSGASKASGTGGFSFGSSGSSGFSFGSTNTAAASTTPVELPDELRDKTVGNVLKSYEDQLEKQSRLFIARAQKIARWDRSIYECLALMEHLEKQIVEVEGWQKDLAKEAEGLLREQDDIIKGLEEKRKGSTAAPQTADQRRRLYKLAHDLGERFLDMEARLKRLVEETEGQSDENESDVGKIVKIANYHLDSMKWIETQCQAIEEQVDKLSKKIGS